MRNGKSCCIFLWEYIDKRKFPLWKLSLYFSLETEAVGSRATTLWTAEIRAVSRCKCHCPSIASQSRAQPWIFAGCRSSAKASFGSCISGRFKKEQTCSTALFSGYPQSKWASVLLNWTRQFCWGSLSLLFLLSCSWGAQWRLTAHKGAECQMDNTETLYRLNWKSWK